MVILKFHLGIENIPNIELIKIFVFLANDHGEPPRSAVGSTDLFVFCGHSLLVRFRPLLQASGETRLSLNSALKSSNGSAQYSRSLHLQTGSCSFEFQIYVNIPIASRPANRHYGDRYASRFVHQGLSFLQKTI